MSGFFEVITSFTRDGDTGSRVLHAIIGVLSIIVGFALLRTPFQSVEVFIFVLGIFWLVQGVMTFVAAFSQKQGRNLRIFMGLLGILAGIIILTYPIFGRRLHPGVHRRPVAGRARGSSRSSPGSSCGTRARKA